MKIVFLDAATLGDVSFAPIEDMDYAASRGIPVKNVAGYSTESVVQSTFMHILSLVGRLPYYDAKVKSGRYSWGGLFTDVSEPFFELAGKTMGIIGMGSIGRRVARVAEAFGMKVIYFSTSGTSHCTEYPSVPLGQLMSESDVVSVHAPLNERTAGLVGAAELGMMKPSSDFEGQASGAAVSDSAYCLGIRGGEKQVSLGNSEEYRGTAAE